MKQHCSEGGELNEEATISKMETVQQEGSRAVKRSVVMYKLDAIIAVGYRVNSIRATQFRQWATSVLRDLKKIPRINMQTNEILTQ